MMRFKWKRTARLGPLFARFSNGRFTSWGVRLGRLTWNATHGRTTFDSPGPGSWTHQHRRGAS